MSTTQTRLEQLHAQRPRNRVVRVTTWVLGIGVLISLVGLQLGIGRLFASADEPGLLRFLREDAKPFALRGPDATFSDLWPWLGKILTDYGLYATWATLLLATTASALAVAFGLLAAPFVSSSLTRKDPYGGTQPGNQPLISTLARNLCLAMRALPEYLLGFLFMALLAGSVWPAVLALAIHNGGIMGRLFGDALEDVRPRPMASLAGSGAKPVGLLLFGGAPLAFSRWLAYFFYRFETCVREATVLGMLGVISIGYHVKEMRMRQFYDEMLVLVALGALLVLAADALSGLVRSRLRRG